MTADKPHSVNPEMSAEEFAALVEEQCQRYLSLTTAEFVGAVRRGEPPDHPVTAHLLLMTGARLEEHGRL